MHSSELVPAPPATGPALLMQLGKLIVRARSTSPSQDARMQAKLLAAKPSTSQIQTQPKLEYQEPQSGEDCQLDSHVQTLWEDQLPVSIEVLLAPSCASCQASLRHPDADFQLNKQKAFLLERWTMETVGKCDTGYITSQWLLNAVRSQLHFSQLSAWLATLQEPTERRRKLSRETCNIKKLESNCDDNELPSDNNKLNIVYSIKISNENKQADFSRNPNTHNFPITSIGSNVYLKVVLQSLPRIDEIPTVKCACKRRNSKEIPTDTHEELVGILNDLSIGSKFQTDLTAINSNIGTSNRRLSIVSNTGSTEYLYTSTPDKDKVVDDRMYMNCSENGKHKCSCDDESDGKSSKIKLDERRLKEIAKYKRRLRKENKMKKQSDSTSSEGDGLKKETHTSIPILQAARFDRFRAIGCYRNQTYLTLPASRIEGKSPFVDTVTLPPQEYKKTNTVSTQTDDISCHCGTPLQDRCEDCVKGMVRSEATYNLASLNASEVLLEAIKRCRDDDTQLINNKKLKCDNFSNKTCDINSFSIIRRPKMKRYDRISSIVNDRAKCDIEELHLKADDTVFSVKPEAKRQKTFSISDDDYVAYEKCDYGTFDQIGDDNGFKFPDPKKLGDVPSPTEMDRFRWTFDSAASMVFHAKTGLPLTSSPAPLRRGNNCFDFDDSINGISGIKSALFHPVCPAQPAPAQPPPRERKPRLRLGPSTGLLGSFEESALKGRLEAVATVHGFTAELGASGAFCPPHKKLPVTVFFYAPGGTNAPYMGHINLGSGGYRVSRSGTIQVSLFNPHGTLVKMFVVLYDLTSMPASARTFLRQRTLYLPAGANAPPPSLLYKYMRYLIHLRFMTSKSGKLYLHTDIRIIVSRKSDLDTATAHSAIFRPIPNKQTEAHHNSTANCHNELANGHNNTVNAHNGSANDNNGFVNNHNGTATNHNGSANDHNGSANAHKGSATVRNGSATDRNGSATDRNGSANNHNDSNHDDLTESQKALSRSPNRVFGGCSEFDTELKNDFKEIGYDTHNGAVSYELRSFTYAPDNPKYSPR